MTLCAWFVLSNHCALAMVIAEKAVASHAAQHSCCPAEPASDHGSLPQERSDVCCKVLRVILPDAENARVAVPAAEAVLFELLWSSDESVRLNLKPLVEMGVAPPEDVRSFAEVVLHRSVLSHAPPTVA